MRKAVILTTGVMLAGTALTGVSSAQDNQRFQMQRANGGFMLMDTQTGTSSFCRESAGEFVCNAASDVPRITESDVEVLRKKITELEARVQALESDKSAALDLPSESEFEQTMNFMERFFQRFIGIVKGLEAETAPKETTPSGRT